MMSDFHLAQYNIGRIRKPLDHPDVSEFIAALGPINTLAEGSPGRHSASIWNEAYEQSRAASNGVAPS